MDKLKTLYLSDLDGTLLRHDQHTSQYTNDVINGLIARGGLFSFATARSEETATPSVKGLTTSAPRIFYNGAVTGGANDGFPQTRVYFDGAVKGIINDLTDNGISPIVYSFIGGEEKFSFIPDTRSFGREKFLETRKRCMRYNPVNTVKELERGDIYYITCIDSQSKLRPFYEKYRSEHYCVFEIDLYTGEQWLEIMPKNATKAHAAVMLKERLNCDELVVFGDNKNDIELFKVADRSYAVANAVPELKAIATDVIASNEDDGVAHFLLEEFFERR